MEWLDKLDAKQKSSVLCGRIRKLVKRQDYQQSELFIKKAIGNDIHAPEPTQSTWLAFGSTGQSFNSYEPF